jgi:MATE family multidrug resistance protein
VTIRVAHSVGRGNTHQCRNLLIGAHATTLIIMATCALTYIFAGGSIARAFTTDPAVITLTGSILIVVGFFQIFDGIQIISMSALRALRDVNQPTAIIFGCFWIVGIPLGTLLAFPFDFGASGLWMGLAAGLVVASISLSVRLITKLRAHDQLATDPLDPPPSLIP